MKRDHTNNVCYYEKGEKSVGNKSSWDISWKSFWKIRRFLSLHRVKCVEEKDLTEDVSNSRNSKALISALDSYWRIHRLEMKGILWMGRTQSADKEMKRWHFERTSVAEFSRLRQFMKKESTEFSRSLVWIRLRLMLITHAWRYVIFGLFKNILKESLWILP